MLPQNFEASLMYFPQIVREKETLGSLLSIFYLKITRKNQKTCQWSDTYS